MEHFHGHYIPNLLFTGFIMKVKTDNLPAYSPNLQINLSIISDISSLFDFLVRSFQILSLLSILTTITACQVLDSSHADYYRHPPTALSGSSHYLSNSLCTARQIVLKHNSLMLQKIFLHFQLPACSTNSEFVNQTCKALPRLSSYLSMLSILF